MELPLHKAISKHFLIWSEESEVVLGRKTSGRERLLQVLDEVIRVFQAYGDSDQRIRNTESEPIGRSVAGVGHRRRLLDQ